MHRINELTLLLPQSIILMNQKFYLTALYCLLFYLSACGTNALDNINWIKRDTNTFSTDVKTIELISGNDSQLIGINVDELISKLGAPTESLLLDRGEKFFMYKVNYSENKQEVNKTVRVRVNAIGLVRESILIN